MEKNIQNNDSLQLERLLSQLATFCNLLQATGGQMQDLALQIQALGGEKKPAASIKNSFLETFGLKKPAAAGEAPNLATALPASAQNELAGQIAELQKSLERKNAQIEDLKKAIGDLKARLDGKMAENSGLQAKCAKLEADYQEQWNEAARLANLLEVSDAEKCSIKTRLEETENRLEDFQNELAGAKDSLDKYQAAFERIQGNKFKPLADSLAHIPDDIRPMVQSYYEIDNLPEFLTQCGHFGRLAQLWQSCRSNIVNGENLAGIECFLSEILKIYNNAFPENPGRETAPEAGSAYDYTTQERVGSNGTRVARVILPGLVQPNGQVAVKALVTLI